MTHVLPVVDVFFIKYMYLRNIFIAWLIFLRAPLPLFPNLRIQIYLPTLFEMKIKYVSHQKEKWLNRQDHLCTFQSSHSLKSWQLHFLLIYCVPSVAFFSLSFPLPLHPHHKAVWQSSLFSFKRMNEDKKQSRMEHERHHLLWFMMAGSLALLCSLPAWLPACSPACLSPRRAL